MERIENVMHTVKGSSTGGTQMFSETLRLKGRKFLKCIAIHNKWEVIPLKTMKLPYLIHMHKFMFRIQDHTKDF